MRWRGPEAGGVETNGTPWGTSLPRSLKSYKVPKLAELLLRDHVVGEVRRWYAPDAIVMDGVRGGGAGAGDPGADPGWAGRDRGGGGSSTGA